MGKSAALDTQSLNSWQILQNPSFKKGMIYCLVTITALSILTTAYGLCGFTPLANQFYLFSHLSNLFIYKKVAIVIVGGLTSIASVTLIVCIHRKSPIKSNPSSNLFSQTTFDSKIKDKLIDFKLKIENEKLKKIIDELCDFLEKGYKNKLDYYSFYYKLSLISIEVLKRSELKDDWELCLKEIDKLTINSINGEKFPPFQIDCSIELKRLNDNLPKLIVEEIDGSTYRGAHIARKKIEVPGMAEVSSILYEAFDGIMPDDYTYLLVQSNCYIIKSSDPNSEDDNQILGTIFFEYTKKDNSLFIHSLARRANAVNLGMTQLFKDHLEQQIKAKNYDRIHCTVDLTNLTAFNIYKKLGFVVTAQNKQHYVMDYKMN